MSSALKNLVWSKPIGHYCGLARTHGLPRSIATPLQVQNGVTPATCRVPVAYSLKTFIRFVVVSNLGCPILQYTAPAKNYTQDDAAWQLPAVERLQGSYEFPKPDDPPFYAGPDPNKAPQCNSNNPLGLIDDSAMGATLLGCYADHKKTPALGNGAFWFSNTEMDAEVG